MSAQTYLSTHTQNGTRVWSCQHRGEPQTSHQTTVDGPLRVYREITQRWDAHDVPVWDGDAGRWTHLGVGSACHVGRLAPVSATTS